MNKRVLIVDDSKLALQVLGDFLAQNGFSPDKASSGVECLDKLSHNEYDLAVIDYVMPDMNGIEVLQAIVKREINLPVIILTGKGTEEVAVQAMKLGALNYVVKTGDYCNLVLEVIKEDLNAYMIIESRRRMKQREKLGQTKEHFDDTSGRDKILVVDDSQFFREMLRDTLMFNNYDVDVATCGLEALEKLSGNGFDLAIVDYIMPDKNGLEVLEELTKRKISIPIIILTGQGSEEVAVQAMRLGAIDYVLKASGHMQIIPDIIRDNLYIYRANLQPQEKQDILNIKERVLIVDDCQTATEKVREMLTAKNYDVESASNATECIEKLSEKKYDLAIIDYIMPGMNGLELLQEIRKNKLDLPVIIATGRGSEEIAVRAIKMGAIDYVVKTVGYLELLPEVIQRNLKLYRINLEKESLEKKLTKKNQELEARIRQLKALNEIGKEMGESLDLNKTLSVILTQIAELLNCTRITVMLLDEKRERLTIKAAKGFPEGEASKVLVKIGEGISGWVAQTGEMLFISNIEENDRFKKRNSEQYFAKSLISVPLKIRDQVIGVINVNNKRANELFTIDDCEILMTMSYNAAIAIENSRRFENFKTAANTDGLTGLFNQTYFYTAIEIEMARCKRYKSPLSLIMLDLDNFKEINDNRGHPVGDKVLSTVAYILGETLRKPDILARYGGEEFAIILPQTDLAGAIKLAERLRTSMEAYMFSSDTDEPLHLTGSFGVVQCRRDMSADVFVKKADDALYEAKKKGKNLCIADSTPAD